MGRKGRPKSIDRFKSPMAELWVPVGTIVGVSKPLSMQPQIEVNGIVLDRIEVVGLVTLINIFLSKKIHSIFPQLDFLLFIFFSRFLFSSI